MAERDKVEVVKKTEVATSAAPPSVRSYVRIVDLSEALKLPAVESAQPRSSGEIELKT